MTSSGGGGVASMKEILKFAEDGLVTRAKLIDNSFDADAIDYRVREESLMPVQRGVYRVQGVPDTFEIRARGACIYAGKELAISHQGAAFLHGIEGFSRPENVEVLLPPYKKATLTGVVVRRTAEPFQSLEIERIRVTSLARTVIDLADQLTMDELETVLNATWRKAKTICPWLRQEIAKLKRKEWAGLDRLCQLLSKMDGRGLDSALELDVLKEIERAGLPKPTKGLVILDDLGRYVIRGDLGWKEFTTVLHVDSVAFHGTEQAMLRDAYQRSELSLLKWTQITVMKRTVKDGVWLAQLDRALRPR